MGDHGMCDRFDWPVKPDEVCDVWASSKTREAHYEIPDGRKVWYDAGDALRDATDLYTVLSELHGTGSPNLENAQARDIVEKLQLGGGLGEVHIGTLRKLLSKHQHAVDRLRRSKDRGGQDMLEIASDGPDSRIIHPTE
jgi:hypothetical protein